MDLFSLTAWSPQIPAGFLVSRCTWELHRRRSGFRVRGYHPLWPAFPNRSTNRSLGNSVPVMRDRPWLPRPPLRNARMLARRKFGLVRVRSPLLPESLLFSSPVGTEMVHFPTFASPNLWIQSGDRQAFTWRGFPIRTFPDHRSRATPRDFSQLTTSFIAAISQGIHRQPLIT